MSSKNRAWTVRDLPSQSGRTWLVTGSTNGVGREVAQAASRAGARLIAPVRNVSRGQVLAEQLRRHGGDVVVHNLDLADLGSIHKFTSEFDEPIDVLVNNAGAVTPRRRETVDGFELILGTNFLGPFALTNRLAHLVRDRVVVVGSGAHHSGQVDAADPHFRHRKWSIAAAYAQSKLCDMLWARALNSKLADSGRDVDVQLAHPGWAYTNIQNVTGRPTLDRAVSAVCRQLGQSAEDGALPVLAAAVNDVPPVTYFGPDGFRNLRGQPIHLEPSPLASDDQAAQAVWDLGVRETGTDL